MKTYRITEAAPADLKRRASSAGDITMSDRAAFYELMRGTIVEKSKIVVPARETSRPLVS